MKVDRLLACMRSWMRGQRPDASQECAVRRNKRLTAYIARASLTILTIQGRYQVAYHVNDGRVAINSVICRHLSSECFLEILSGTHPAACHAMHACVPSRMSVNIYMLYICRQKRATHPHAPNKGYSCHIRTPCGHLCPGGPGTAAHLAAAAAVADHLHARAGAESSRVTNEPQVRGCCGLWPTERHGNLNKAYKLILADDFSHNF